MTLKKAIRCGTAIAACWMVPAWLPAQELYWTEYSGEAGTVRIQTSDINGENVDTLFAPTEMASFAVDVEVTDTHIFWSGHNGGDVWRASLDGTEPPVQIIAPGEGLQSVHNLAVDESTGTLYIADQNLGIFSAGLDGSNLTNLWGTVPTLYSGIQVRSSNQILWVSRETGYLYIQELPAGPFPEAVLLEGGADIYGLAYDPVSDAVYYTSHTGGTLRSYNLTTAEHNLLKSGLHQPLGVKLSPGGNHLLIAERGKGISVFQLDNKQYKLLVEASGAHFGVAATADPAEVLPPPVGTVLWSADFEADVADGAPAANWGDVSGPDDGEAQVVKDDLNAFGFGTDNQFLRVNQVLSLGLRSEPLPVTTEVVTFSFDFIGRFKEGDGRWLQAMIYDANSYAHITSIRTGDENIRGAPDNPSYGGNDLPIRMETIFNNSAESITYEDPAGNPHELASGQASLWVYHYTTSLWEQLVESYNAYRHANAGLGPIQTIYFLADGGGSGDVKLTRTFDLDNVAVRMGGYLSDLEGDIYVPPPPPFEGHLAADFEGIPLGEITRAASGSFLHGNISSFGFHTRYDNRDDGRDPEDYEPPPLLVVEDTENRFGGGTTNQILRTNGARGWTIYAQNNFNMEVMTVRTDMIVDPIAGSRLTYHLLDGEELRAARVELEATDPEHGTFLGGSGQNPGTWDYGVLNRFEAVVNNSAETITYTAPNGTTETLIAGGTDMWVNGILVFDDSLDQRNATSYGPIMAFELRTYSTNPWLADIALIQTYEGVELVPAGEGGVTFVDWTALHFPGEDDPAIIGPDADADGDGIPNLLEYALGLTPGEPGRTGLPVHGVQTFNGEGVDGNYLTLSFRAPDAVGDISFTVGAGSDLGGLNDPAHLESVTSNGDGTSTYLFRDVEPLETSERRFLRLNVSLHP